MRAKGIAYDTGFVQGGRSSVERFDLGRVRADLTVVRDELHCNAVHLVGGDAARLEAAAGIAGELGLEVWFSPYPIDLEPRELTALFLDCAERAERLRAAGVAVVFVAGVELSLMNRGFLDGDGIEERLAGLFADRQRITGLRERLDGFLREVVPAIRGRFGGPVTYAAVPLEEPDWSLFDYVTLELIRSAEVAHLFRDGVRKLVAQGRPVAVTGFGCATWKGAGDVAPRSMEVLVHERDEAGQAEYLGEVLDVFLEEGVDAAFVYLFALATHPHRPGGDPRDDLDLGSLGIVKVFDDGHWEPKAAFGAVAGRYR